MFFWKTYTIARQWWCTPFIPALGRQSWRDPCEFKANLVNRDSHQCYMEKPCLGKKLRKEKQREKNLHIKENWHCWYSMLPRFRRPSTGFPGPLSSRNWLDTHLQKQGKLIRKWYTPKEGGGDWKKGNMKCILPQRINVLMSHKHSTWSIVIEAMV